MKVSKLLNFKTDDHNERTAVVKRNIIGSGILRVISIFTSLVIVPLTVDYISPEGYGIWLTISSIIGWLSYFDLGLAQGFRNKFAEAIALDNYSLARKYISTTYITLTIIFSIILFLTNVANYWIDWCLVLNIDSRYGITLKYVFTILSSTFCVTMVANTLVMMFNAMQKTAQASLIQTIGQVFALFGVWILTIISKGSLPALALFYSGIPCIILIGFSIYYYNFTNYKKYKPTLKDYDKSVIPQILNLGINFFIVMLSMLCIFQSINIIISRLLGPEVVSEYNIAYKYFNVLKMLSIIILTPCWSAFTEAYVKHDFSWMKRTKRKLERMWVVMLVIIVIMTILAPTVFNIWVGDKIIIPMRIIIITAFYIIVQILASTYMYLINGIGKIRLQMIIYASFTFLSIPLMTILGNKYDLLGILCIPILIFLIQAILANKQLTLLIENKATGIWNK